ncbi:hypothetical protein, partial [Mycobacterium marinum]
MASGADDAIATSLAGMASKTAARSGARTSRSKAASGGASRGGRATASAG